MGGDRAGVMLVMMVVKGMVVKGMDVSEDKWRWGWGWDRVGMKVRSWGPSRIRPKRQV
jgi:hypothetical protein